MSAIRLTKPAMSIASVQRNNPAVYRVSATIIAGLVVIGLLRLVLGVATSEGAYEMARLKAQKHDLITTSEILQSQVDSLSSDQNLANAAQGLGMIANSSPAFLRLSDQKVFGKPKAAYLGTTSHTARNLVPNSQLQTKTNVGRLVANEAANVATTNPAATALTWNAGDLPVSPTH